MRGALAFLLVIHGLVHLLGFLKEWGLASLPQIGHGGVLAPAAWQRPVGLAWLVACLAFLAAAALLLAHAQRWWLVAAVALVLSQLLVINAWPSARAGTLVNVALVIPIVVAAALARFGHDSEEAARRLLAHAQAGTPGVVTAQDLAPLPAPVRRWLERAGVVGRPRTRVVRLKQAGWMRTAPDQAWMPTRARQYFSVEPPAFVWDVDVVMKKVLPVVGRDSYQDGHGRMLIKAAGLVSVVDGTGPAIDQGTLLRFLGEIIWFPSAALAPYLRWEAIDDHAARATMTHAGVSASAVFTFDEEGRMTGLSADRYMGSGAGARLERWEARSQDWAVLDGVRVPVQGTVGWRLEAGEFVYYRWQITELELDRGELYPARDAAPAVKATAFAAATRTIEARAP